MIIHEPAVRPWIAPLGLLAASGLGGLLLRRVVLRRLETYFARTETKLDDLLLRIVDGHLPLWVVLAGVSAAAQASPLGEAHRLLIQKGAVTGFFISLTIAAATFSAGSVRLYSDAFEASSPTTTLTENVVRAVVILMGALLVLANLGISITPVLTALGVGSLAIALALQDTLLNLFAGIYLVASDVVAVGHYIKLDSGQEGYVVDVGWRATRVRTLPNNIVLIPNLKLAQAIVTDTHRPETEMAVLVQMGVAYGSDLARVERVTVEVAADVQKTVEGAVPGHQPFIRYHTLADSSINFSVILRGRQFVDQYLISHEFIKRVHARYAKEGISIPFPQRDVHLSRA